MSDKPSSSSFAVKLVVAAAVLAAIGLGIRQYVRPVAQVEEVVSGQAVDAKPGSVTVKEEYTMQMKTETAGRVLGKDYQLLPGNFVKAGDVLVRLDTGDVEIALEQARNEYQADKDRIAVGSPSKYLLEQAQSELTNEERLYKMGQKSDAEYQKARRAVDTLVQTIAVENVVNQANLRADETKIKSQERALEKMTVIAPFEGQISQVFAHPGDLINTGDPIVSLITQSRLVEAKISEEDFADIKVGQKATLIFLPYGEFEYNGEVTKVLPTPDPETQRHLVDIKVNDIEPAKLTPGITGEVSIIVGTHMAKAIVPRRAVLNEHVFVVKDGKVELRKVKTGYVWLTGIEVTEGLDPGEQVVVEDLELFRDGDSVRSEVLPSDAFGRKK